MNSNKIHTAHRPIQLHHGSENIKVRRNIKQLRREETNSGQYGGSLSLSGHSTRS